MTDTVTGLIWLKQANCLGLKQWAAATQAAALGLGHRLASVRPLDMGVLEMDAEPARSKARKQSTAVTA